MASGNIDLSLFPWGHNVSHMTAGYLQCLLSLALSNHDTLHWSRVGPRLDFSCTDWCKGVCFPSFGSGAVLPQITCKNVQHASHFGEVWAVRFVCVCLGTRRERDVLQEAWIVRRNNESQAGLSYKWASRGHFLPDWSINWTKMENETTWMDLNPNKGNKSPKLQRDVAICF